MTPEENLARLPAACYGVQPSTGELIAIRRGETGFWPVTVLPLWAFRMTAEEACNRLNAQRGIARHVRQAMECGSMFGWDVPGAVPENNLELYK